MDPDAAFEVDSELGGHGGVGKEKRKRKAPGASNKTRKKPQKIPVDPSTWPKSRVPASVWIRKGVAQDQYRLKKEDFNDLFVDVRKNGMFLPNGVELSTHYYREREIERQAWIKHGGPEGFKAYIEKLKAQKMKMTVRNGKPFRFPEPFPYYTIDVLGPLAMMQSASIQEDMMEMLFPPWLWQDLRQYAIAPRAQQRLEMLRVAVRQKLWEQYPERPDTPVPSSKAFRDLQSLLSGAPSHKDSIQSLDMEFFDSGGIERCEWSRDFKDRVNNAVEAVLQKHDAQGKTLALWLLYETYVRCIRCHGLQYVRVGYDRESTTHWEDDAAIVFKQPL